jgi:hypothetical protein
MFCFLVFNVAISRPILAARQDKQWPVLLACRAAQQESKRSWGELCTILVRIGLI